MSLEDDQERAGTSSAGPSCSKKQSPASTSRWRTVRPWKPMDDFKDKYQLEVIEVGPTAVALALYSPTSLAASRNSSRRNSRDSSDFLQVSGSFNASTPDARDRGQASLSSSGIVVKVNSQPWACVSHAGSAGVDDEWRDASMVVVVWNLEPGKEYRVELDVLENVMKETDADKSAWTMVETTREHEGSRRPVNRGKRKSNATMSHQSLASSSSQSHDVRSDEIDDAPPPYSAVATPEPEEDESQLRAILKSLRASHKQAESVLKNSIATLKKSLDKANKDDIRTRQRITQLEEGIKKSRERASLEIPREMEVVEDEIKALQEEESRLRKELERRSRNVERTQEDDASILDELMEELEHLEKQEKQRKKDKRAKEKSMVSNLESELAKLDQELKRMEEEDVEEPQRFRAPFQPLRPTSREGFFSRFRKNTIPSPSTEPLPLIAPNAEVLAPPPTIPSNSPGTMTTPVSIPGPPPPPVQDPSTAMASTTPTSRAFFSRRKAPLSTPPGIVEEKGKELGEAITLKEATPKKTSWAEKAKASLSKA